MDTNGQLTFNDDDSTIQYKEGIQYVAHREFKKAYTFFTDLNQTYGYPYLKDVLLIVQFWAERYAIINEIPKPKEKVNYLKELWDEFELYYSEYGISNNEIHNLLEKIIRHQIIELLVKQFQSSEIPDIDALIMLGEYFVQDGDFEKAEETFSYANRLNPHNVKILSYLSDLYSMKNNDKQAKILLKEAFLINPNDVPVEHLKSDIIKSIQKLTQELGYTTNQKSWMPVIGVCFNIFNVKKHLTKEEVLSLEEDCRHLSKLLATQDDKAQTVKPILMYKYLLLLDNLLIDGNINSKRFVMYERQLKILDLKLYSMYINKVLENGEESYG